MTFGTFHKQKYFEAFSNEKILKNFRNMLELYMPVQSGSILDIGCGQSEYILDSLKKNFEFVAVDQDVDELTRLRKRIQMISEDHLSKIRFVHSTFESLILEDQLFDGIVLSNILHFFPLEQTFLLINGLRKHIKTGTVIVVVVHNGEHPCSRGEDPFSFFKHYFSHGDLESLFSKKDFDYLYSSTTSARPNPEYVEFTNDCLLEYLSLKGASQQHFERTKNHYWSVNRTENISIVLQKK
jgi:SAM-dependent methyltransferase